MQHDEWNEKAQEIAGGIINPDSVMRYTSKQDAGEWIANLAREAYQRGRNEADAAAERRGIERAAKIADEYADWTYWGQYANASAAEAAAAEIAKAIRLGRWLTPDEISTLDHIGKAPLEGKAAKEYQRGYADALRALAQPMADAGPMEPAGASDREGT